MAQGFTFAEAFQPPAPSEKPGGFSFAEALGGETVAGFPRVTPQVQAARDTDRLAILERELAIQKAAGRVDPDLQAEIANARRQAGVPAPQPTAAPQSAAQPQSGGRNVVSRNPLTEDQVAKLFAATPVAPPKEAKSVSVTPGFAIIPPTLGRRQKPAEAATPAAEKKPEGAADKSKPLVYPNKTYALDDAVNWLEEGANQDKVINAFSKIGVTWDEIVRHGKERNSEYFKQQAVPPVPSDLLPFGKMREKRKASGEITSLEPKPEDQSVFRQVADLPLGYTQGVVQGIRMIADTMGAEKSKSLRAAEDYIGRLMSAQSRQDKEEQSKIMKEAEDKGVLDQLKAGLKALSVAPAQTLINAFGTSAPAIIAGAAATALGAPGAAVTGVLVGTGALMGAGSIKGAIYEVTKEELEKIGVRKEEAEKRATEAQKYGGKNLDQILLGTVLGAGASAIGMESGVAKALAANIIKKSAVKLNEQAEKQSIAQITKTLTAAGLKEGTPEFAQGFQEMVAKNVALQREGFNVPTYRGAVAAGTLEGLAGVGLGVSAKAAPMIYGATLTPEQKFARALQGDIDATIFTQEGIQREARGAARGIAPETIAKLAARSAIKPPPQKPQAEQAEGAAAPEGRIEPSMAAEPSVQEPAGRVEPIVGPAAPVEVGPRAVEAIPGMPTGEELAEPEVTPVTKVEAAKPAATPAPAPAEQPVITPITPAEAPAPTAAGEVDPLFNQAAAVVLKTRRPSISFIQRHLHIEYDRAARLIEQMEQNGLVSPINSMGNREVLVPDPTAVPAVDTSAPTAAKPEPSEAPAVKPTKAAESMPETPTVPPVTAPKVFEPPAPQHEVKGIPIQEIPLSDLKLSKDVPQFKIGASEEGEVEPLGGEFERVGVPAIQVWRRLNGSLEVISGRHRLAHARRRGEETIPSQIHDESKGFDAKAAETLDAELNIRDGHGKVKDYVNYFKGSNISRKEADARGLLARTMGKRAYAIATEGSDELITAVRSDQVGDEAAYYIALNAPSDARLQGVGIKAIMDNKSMNTAVNMMQAVKALAGENETTTDMFGFDDSAIKEAEEMAKIAASKQREIQTRLSAISGAARNPAVAKAEGIDIRDPEAVKRRIDELRQKKSAWENWSTNPDLVSEVRAARGVAAPELNPIVEPLSNQPAGPSTLEKPADNIDTPAEEAAQIKNKAIRDKLMEVAKNLGVRVFEASGRPMAGDGYVQIPPEDKLVEGSRSAEQVFAHELGHAIMQKRGMSFNSIPHEQIASKWIKGWTQIREISKAFRPEVYKNKTPKIRRHANKPNEIIADALGSFLLGQTSRAQIQPLLDGIGLSDYDLGLKKRSAASDVIAPELTPIEQPAAGPDLELTAPTPQDLRAKDEGRERAEEKAIADREVDLFQLQPQVAEKEAPPQTDLFAGEAAPSAEYQAALEKSRRAGEAFRKVQEAYRKKEIGDEDFLAGRRVYDAAMEEYDRAYRKERGEPESTEKEGEAPNESDTGFRGASDEEVADVAEAFDEFKENQNDNGVTKVLNPPKKSEIVRIENKARIYVANGGYMTVEQAKARIAEWKKNANEQGKSRRNSEKIVLSLFDTTGEWSKPWEEAGYQVYRFDIQDDPEFGDVNNFSTDFFNDNYGAFEGQDIYAVLAACPCTDFAVSGARHFAAKDADGRTRESVELVRQTLATIEYFKPSIWAIENPVGRIEKLTGLPPWRLSFNPNHFGDPYTKKTLLWGRFNADLPIAPVEATEGSKMHRMYGGKSQATKNARSVTPEGFAYAFFDANNAIDHPVMAIANKYDMMKPSVFRKALAAGMSENQISEVIDDPYYIDVDYRQAERDLMEAVKEIKTPEVETPPIKTTLENIEQPIANAGMAGWSNDRISSLIQEYGYSDGRTTGIAATIDPPSFLYATTDSQKTVESILKEAGTLNKEDLAKESQTPFLQVDVKEDGTWTIVGHEGRHRMAAMHDAGVTSTPVVLQMRRGGFKYPSVFEPSETKELLGQKFRTGDGLDVDVHNLVPITRANAGTLASKFGAGAFLYNIEPTTTPSQATQESNVILGDSEIRKEKIKELAKLRRELGKVPEKVAAGEVSIDMQRNVTRLMQTTRELQTAIRELKPRRDSAEVFLAKALKEYDEGNLEKDVLDVIQAAYLRTPELLDGLLLSVITPTKRDIAGNFNPLRRAVTLYKRTDGVYDPVTIRHELTHSLEQMMTPEQRMAVVQAWGKALQRAIKQNPDDLHQEYFHALLDFFDNPTEIQHRKTLSVLPSLDMYQFINPSEFWAVNAEKLMAAELGSAWAKFKRAVRKLLEGMKKVLGFDSKYDIHKVFNQVMGGSKERISDSMLVEMVKRTDGDFTLLNNIEENKQLVQKYNRPKTPMLDKSPIKTFITKQFQSGKEFVRDVATSPIETTKSAANSVIDGMIYLRNQNVWYGSGLEARDFDRYNGELRTSEGIVTASVALDNAIRSGNIGVEVIFKGGIEYNKKLGNYVAVDRDLGMHGVYKAEAAMKKKLGDQLGTDIIQGYLEAKRSISIMNELYEREAAFEAAKTNHQAMKDMKADADQIAQAKSAEEELKKELEGIKKAASSVNMSEEERYEFAALDEKHPELRDMMENWNAINQNLLTFWRQVGLLSQGRYEALSAIKDYVPWYRIMNDELDLHDSDQSAVQSTTRSMTNIGVEKLFKRGRPISVVDFRAKEGQKDFKIQPSSVVTVEVNGKKVNQDLISVTPSGEVHVEMDLKENDLVVFKTNREIQNIVDNMTRNVMRMTMNGIRQFAANRIVLEYASRDAKNKIMVFPSVDKNKGRFNWVVNGKKVVVEIRDPLVAAAIYGMDNLNLRMLAPLAAVANLTRRTITLSGVFQIKQVFKDAPTAAIVTGVKNPMALIGGVWKGFLTSLTKTDPVVDILKSAGIGGFMSPARTPEADIKLRLGIMNGNVFSSIIKFLDHIGDSSDMAQRVATYKRVLAETGDETQALYQAANVINFLHHGASGYAQAAVKTVPFMGAYANSIDVLIRALVGSGLKGMSRKKAVLARLSVTASLLAGATLLYCMLAGADPDYDELDDQTKLKNIIIPGTKIMLPMNTSAAYFFKAIPEMIYNKVTREGTENEYDRQRLRKALGNAAREMLLGPEPVPAGIKPVLEVGIKHSFFTGRPIVPEGLKDVAAAEQYTATTSELGKRLSAMMEIPGTDGKRVINPIEADHLVRGLFGTAGAMVQWISNSIGVMAESRPELMAREQPITGSFLRDEVPRGREDLFYDFKKEVFEKHKTWKKMVDREDFESADKYLEKHGDVASMYEYINDTEQDLKEINAEIRRLGETRSKDMTPKERREEIDELRKIKQELFEPVKEMRREVLNQKTR